MNGLVHPSVGHTFLSHGLSGWRGIVVACVCPSVRPSVSLSICKLYFCPHDNSSQIGSGITKFAPNTHHGILSVGIENRGHWSWPSRSFWLRILGNLDCPHDNSSSIWARITKFAPNMHPWILSACMENGVIDIDLQGHFGHFDSEF